MKTTAIVPVYNVETYLEECLDSLVSQTECFDEIILINDGSTDGSRNICEKYCRHYPVMRLVNQENKGLAAARNVGMELASGDYIVFVDSDDYVSKNLNCRIKDMAETLDMEVLVYNASIQYDQPSKEKRSTYMHKEELNGRLMTGMEYFEQSFPVHYSVTAWIAAYKKDFLESNNIIFPEGIYFEDNYFNLQVITHAAKIFCIPDSLYIRRCRENSIMNSSMSEKKCRDTAVCQQLLWEFLVTSDEWLAKKELLARFVSFGVLHALYSLEGCRDEELKKRTRQKLAELFLRHWHALFREYHACWGINLALLSVLKEQSRTPGADYTETCKKWEQKIREQLAEKTSSLPFNRKDIKLGIYGIGRHTEILSEFYQKEVGSISADLFFVTSGQEDIRAFHGKKVYRYTEIPDDTTYILISSYVYQQEMYDNLLEQKFDKDKILLFYEETDICDLVMFHWVVTQ